MDYQMASPANSSDSSSSSSSIHPSSLIDPALHSPHLLRLIDIKISRHVIDHVIDQVVSTVDHAMGRPTPSTSLTRGRPLARRPEHAKFTTFVTNVLTRAEITTPTLLASLVYIHRARPFLHIALEEWALERVFLGALIVASKYLNDSTLKNVHWALCTGVFGKRDVGRIEREFLGVLDFELGIRETDLLTLCEGLEFVIEEEDQHLRVDKRTTASVVVAPQNVSSRKRNHNRTSVASVHTICLPQLDASSPSSSSSSSDGSSSPQTPPTPISPAHHRHSKDDKDGMSLDQDDDDQRQQSTVKKPRNFQSTTMDLLRSFPLPMTQTARPRKALPERSRHHHHPHGMAIRVVA